MVYKLPEQLSFEEGAAFPVNYATAQAGLVVMAGLKKGERVLIHAAAGGVGISATQIAKRIGAEIFGTASASKHDAIREQGVDHAIDYRSQDFVTEVRRLTGGEGIDVAFDALGPTSFRKDYTLLRPGGRPCQSSAETRGSELSQRGHNVESPPARHRLSTVGAPEGADVARLRRRRGLVTKTPHGAGGQGHAKRSGAIRRLPW